MIKKPMHFMEALLFLLNKEQLPAEWDSQDWLEHGEDLKRKAFYSARVENARFLDRAQGLLFDYMAETTEEVVGPDGVKRTALRVTGRADFVRLMREFMVKEGMATERELFDTDQSDVTDIKSERRLRLVFDTNVRQAYGFGHWNQGMKPAVLRRFPAARLVRDRGVAEPRPRHVKNEGEVRLKTDTTWWADYINDPDPKFGGFGVPWGPFGFGSGMGQEDVSREQARELGLDVDSVGEPVSKKLTDGMKASTGKMDPAIKKKLLDELKKEPTHEQVMERARQAGRDAAERARKRAEANR